MLDANRHQALDGELSAMLNLLDAGGDPVAAAQRLLDAMTRGPGREDISTQCLLRPGWRREWEDLGGLTTAWFGYADHDGRHHHDVGHDEGVRLLYDAFNALVRLALDSRTAHRRARNAEGLRAALQDYLDSRGILSPNQPASPGPAGPPCILSLGDRRYQVGGGQPFVVTENEDNVLQAFLGAPALDERMLVEGSRVNDAARVLRALPTKYDGVMAPAIRLARRKGQGGYRVQVALAPPPG